MTPKQAYKKALKTGWTKILEDIVYAESEIYISYKYGFSIDVAGANLVRYINTCYISETFELYDWIRIVIDVGINSLSLIPAINASKLKKYQKLELIKYVEGLLIKQIMA